MSDRVSCEEISTVMDRIQEKLDIKVPNRLYRLVAARTGLHPTTVLRYHRRSIESADVKIMCCLLDLEKRIEDEEGSLTEEEASVLYPYTGTCDTIPQLSAFEVQRRFESILALLEDPDPGLVYGYVSRKLGVPPEAVLRYHAGDTASAPESLVTVLRDLERKLSSDEPVVFEQLPPDGTRLVPRRYASALLEEIRSLRVLPDEPHLESFLERVLRLGEGTLAALSDRQGRKFVSYETFRLLSLLRESFMYDPSRVYEIGDRIHHHELGVGTVVGKYHKSRILVEFDEGSKRLLCEDVAVDPRWPHPMV